VADDQIVSGRIDLGRCMFCGLCMESCGFTSFFMTNEYDGMSGFTRQELWFDASRTRVLPNVHQEAVDTELAKRANKERDKRAKKAAREAKAASEESA
jgi:formate hydrogenlyase subunit 6/NADH:ubiquinone oxidoreductase subunit I